MQIERKNVNKCIRRMKSFKRDKGNEALISACIPELCRRLKEERRKKGRYIIIDGEEDENRIYTAVEFFNAYVEVTKSSDKYKKYRINDLIG